MTPERWQTIERLFNEAVALSVSEREQWLASACADDAELRREVEQMLAADAENSAGHLAGDVHRTLLSMAGHHVPRRVGPYELLDEIGSGGMGTVYKAQRIDSEYDSIVAVKLVRPGVGGESIVQRFRQERQILARLTHASIARLLDGGTTDDGIPYIVMEYIEGEWITDYCDGKSLDVRGRLELFLPVCAAVDHAHHHFIVHRDIKPNNILIDRNGTPKLLDFGISKLLHVDGREPELPLTQSLAMLTPHYASPEQVLGEAVSTRSDVYSLGTVLYELLAGTRAHTFEKLTPGAIEDAICRKDTVAPSVAAKDARLTRKLAGDLDNIVLRAMQKEPDRRYESAAALADDIRRYLDDLPVHARPDTTLYRARKFVRRHRALVIGTVAVVATSMVGSVVAIRQARLAQSREQQVRGLARSFIFDVHDSIKELPGATVARQKIVTTALQYLDALAGSHPGEPELLRELAAGYTRIADVQGGNQRGSNLGDLSGARVSYTKALTHLERLLAVVPDDRDAAINRVVVYQQLADLDVRTQGAPRALPSVTRVVTLGQELLRRYPDSRQVRERVADVLISATQYTRQALKLTDSLASGTEALQIIEPLASELPHDKDVLELLGSAESAVGMTQARLGNLRESLAHYRRAVIADERLNELDARNVAARRMLMLAYSHVGDVLGYGQLPNLGDTAGAEKAFRQMTALAKELYEADAHDTRGAIDYGFALMRLGIVLPLDHPEKQESLEHAASLLSAVLSGSAGNVIVRNSLGFLELQLGRLYDVEGRSEAATTHYRRAMDLSSTLLGSGTVTPRSTYVSAASYAAVLEAAGGRQDAALGLLDRAAKVAAQQVAETTVDTPLDGRMMEAEILTGRSLVHRRLGRSEDAARWRAEALAAWSQLSRPAAAAGYGSLLRIHLQRLGVPPEEVAAATTFARN